MLQKSLEKKSLVIMICSGYFLISTVRLGNSKDMIFFLINYFLLQGLKQENSRTYIETLNQGLFRDLAKFGS